MSKLADWNKEKLAARMKAKATRPEKPRYGEESNLNAALINAEKGMPDINKPVNDSYDAMQKRWSQGKSGGGDAFIEGLQAGMQRNSLIDDKKKMKKFTSGMEKLKAMVEDTNQRLYQEEKLDSARRSLEPRVFAYLEQAKKMAPDQRRVYIQGAMDEYNKLAGTDYRIASVDDMEPWKVMVMDGGQLQQINLMEFVKNNQTKELDLYLKSTEADNIERDARAEDAAVNTQRQDAHTLAQLKKEKFQSEKSGLEDYRTVERQIKEESGDDVRVISSMPTSLQLNAEKQVQKYTELANHDLIAEKRLDRAYEIAKNHPDLFSNLNTIIVNRYHEDPNFILNLLKNKIPERDREVAPELIGIVKNIFTDSVKGVSPKAMNIFLEKKMESGSPNMRWTAKSFMKVVKEAKDEYSADYNEHKKAADYGQRGLLYRVKAKERKPAASQNDAETVNRLQQKDPTLTPEDIKEAQRIFNARK